MGANINISDFLIIFFVLNVVHIQKQRKQKENKKKGKKKEKQNKTRIKFESHCTLKLINFLSTVMPYYNHDSLIVNKK